MRKAVLTPLSTALVLAGLWIPLQFAQGDILTERKILLAQAVGTDAWRRANDRRERENIRRAQREQQKAEREARRARNEKQFKDANERWEKARREEWEARERRRLPLEPIPR